jgi:molybdenum cofactor biosynthesis enzyme MoaA
MSNIFKSIVDGVEKVVEAPVKFVEKIATIFEQVKTDEPELRAALVGMVGKAEAVGGDIAVDVTADGLNVTADLATLKAAGDLVSYFRSSVAPLIEQVYGQVKSDLSPTASTVTTVTAAVSTVAQSGPGLHTVVAQ